MNNIGKEYCVTHVLPPDGERVMAFGHKTFCCQEDMEEVPQWHDVTFMFVFSEMKIKKEIPKNPEESILEFCNFIECWQVNDDEETHLVGVTKWKYFIPKCQAIHSRVPIVTEEGAKLVCKEGCDENS